MKNQLIATALIAVTASAVVFYPGLDAEPLDPVTPVQPIQLPHQPLVDPIAQSQTKPKIEVVFVLDTTGSMSGMIEAAKEKIWSIATTMASADPAPEIKIGLVAYRDRGDAYITKKIDLTTDIDAVYGELMQFRAQGGGDTPESVNQALYEAVNDMNWTAPNLSNTQSDGDDSYRVVFLVGDAPPHMDYKNDVPYQQTLGLAMQKGIVVNTIQCGNSPSTRQNWQHMASLAGGDYFTVEQNGGALAMSTPYDKKIAELAKKIEDTRVFYGSSEKRAEMKRKEAASEVLYEKASSAALARRAEFNSTASGAKNLLGDSELVDDVANGKVDLDKLDQSLLPEPIQAMAPAAQKQVIEEKISLRSRLKAELEALTKERRAYVEKEVAEVDAAEESLDYQVFETLKKQAKSKGLEYKDSDLRL